MNNHQVGITNERTGATIAERATWCSNPWTRFRGLMFRASLPTSEGIVLMPCGSVHMAFMRFAIDVIYLDREQKAAKLVRRLKPYRVSFGGRRAHAAIELPAGTLEGLDIRVGDGLMMRDYLAEEATT